MTWLSFLVATPTMLVVLVFEFMLYPTKYPHLAESLQAVPNMLGLIYAITVAYTINYTVMAWCIRHSAVTIVSVSTYLDICEREACFYLHYQHINTKNHRIHLSRSLRGSDFPRFTDSDSKQEVRKEAESRECSGKGD